MGRPKQFSYVITAMVVIGRSKESREKSRRFLQAVYDGGGKARTSEIRQRSGLSRSDIKYRYESLEQKGLISIEYDDESVAGPNESAQKIAILTDFACEEIENKGLLQGGHYQPEKATRDVDELAAQVDTLKERVRAQEEQIEQLQRYITETVYRNISMLRWSIARLEIAVETDDRPLGSFDPSERISALKQRVKNFEVDHVTK